MKHMSTVLILVICLASLSFAQGKLGLQVGYWSPSLDEINDGLRELGAMERFSGGVIFGADYLHPLNEQWDIKVEGFYWSQEISEEGGEASVSIIPIMVSGVYKIEAKGSQIMPYVGAGIGLGFVSWELVAVGEGSIDDTANPFMFHFLGGIHYPTSDTMFLFAEAGYVIGSFNAKNADVGFNEDVSMNGFSIKGGLRFQLN